MKKIVPFFWCALPIGFVEALWLINQQPFSFLQAAGVFFVSLTTLALPELLWINEGNKRIRRARLVGLALLLACGMIYFLDIDGLAGAGAFLAISFLAAVCLLAAEILTSECHPVFLWGVAAAMALFFGAAVLGTLQVMERFSEEEFFAAVQWALVSGWWLALYAAWRGAFHPREKLKKFSRCPLRAVLFILLIACLLGFAPVMLKQYQASFYPRQTTTYMGINSEQPFLCGKVVNPAGDSVYESGKVFQGIIEQVAANPVKTVTLLGMLSLASDDSQWKEAFHQGLLEEARQGSYTGPAGSVKYGQYETALRAYYFHEVNLENPDLFTAEEQQIILRWLAAVNRRSMTVEWVDWMYAAAFGEWPKGPYLNQENGAGLLALLESYGYADPELDEQNQAFLREHDIGWTQRFRNTDDSISYQSLWINNAIFQSLFHGTPQAEQVRKSYEWLLYQAVPDGSLYGYNPSQVSLAAPAYLGAQLTGDGRLLWLAGRSLEYLQSRNLPIFDQPGLKAPVALSSDQPKTGSCLLFGDSGTPVKVGPLAPDKIVFRDGWNPDDRYLSLNLRFTGWHRYKATNSVISIYQGEPLIVERTDSPATGWLPVGRSQFRDKRIPRENLNGLVIPRQGLSRLIFWLTGFGSPWAQDPPFYATVERFETGADMDVSVTQIAWNGWTQVRSIYFVHDGPTAVIDQVRGPANQSPGITWHAVVPANVEVRGNSIDLGVSGKVEMRLAAAGEGDLSYQRGEIKGQPGMDILYMGQRGETMALATVFLDGEWLGAKVQALENAVIIRQGEKSFQIPISPLE